VLLRVGKLVNFISDTDRKPLGTVTQESGDDIGTKKCDIQY